VECGGKQKQKQREGKRERKKDGPVHVISEVDVEGWKKREKVEKKRRGISLEAAGKQTSFSSDHSNGS